MKVLKVLLTIVISFILVILITSLTVTSQLKNVIQNEVVKEAIKQSIVKKDEEENLLNNEAVNNLINDSDANKVIDCVINDYVGAIESDSKISDETINSIIKYAKEHKDELEEITGQKVDIEEITSEETKEELTNALNDALEEIKKDTDDNTKTVITTYSKLTSDSLKITMVSIILGLVVLLALINWSLYKWLRPTGISLIISSVLVIITYLLSLALASMIEESMNITINTNALLSSGIIELISGIIFIIIFAIIKKNKNKNEIKA